ncbi:MAG: hypothetical protein HUU01_18950, partial [Saprospiraceae bacterium]|nr:hypothetical protein [Saprospiraceae bacterium]
MSLVAPNIIEIDGWKKEWVFNTLTLRQTYNDHHVFEISVLVPETTKNNPAFTASELAGLLGKDVFLNIRIEALETPQDGKVSNPGKNKIGATCHFEGFVDEVVPVWTPKACMLRITGYSKTIFMDCGPQFRTFYQKSVGEIVQKITSGYSRKIPAPVLNGAGMQADFSVQTQETDYRYLCRLADTYGKVFYFDGKQLHFGDLEKREGAGAIELEFGEDLKQASIGLNIAPLNFELGAYKMETNDIASYSAVNDCPSSHLLANLAIKKSAVYPAPKMHLPNITPGVPELKRKANQLLAKQAYGLVQFTGASDLPSLKIGSKISVKGAPEIVGQGEFII